MQSTNYSLFYHRMPYNSTSFSGIPRTDIPQSKIPKGILVFCDYQGKAQRRYAMISVMLVKGRPDCKMKLDMMQQPRTVLDSSGLFL